MSARQGFQGLGRKFADGMRCTFVTRSSAGRADKNGCSEHAPTDAAQLKNRKFLPI